MNYSEEQGDDLDFEFEDREEFVVIVSTIPAPPPIVALGDSWFEELE